MEAKKKIRIPFAVGVEWVLEMVKSQAIAEETGKNNSWLSDVKAGRKPLTDKYLNTLNPALERLGERISEFRIVKCDDREAVAAQVKELMPMVNMRYLVEHAMGKEMGWLKNRMTMPMMYEFREEELAVMNLALVEIGARLSALELIK